MDKARTVESRLQARVNQANMRGQTLSDLQIAMVRRALEIDPNEWAEDRTALATIRKVLKRDGIWSDTYEWRISTRNDLSIRKAEHDSRTIYSVRVSCGGEVLSCDCYELDVAYVHMKLYERLIIEGFWSIGPPWIQRK